MTRSGCKSRFVDLNDADHLVIEASRIVYRIFAAVENWAEQDEIHIGA